MKLLFQRRILIWSFALFAIMQACSSPKELSTTPIERPKGVDPALVYQNYLDESVSLTSIEDIPTASLFGFANEELDANILVASLQRTRCYAKCPAYEAKVFANGLVLFDGQRHMDREGLYEGYLVQEQIDSLFTKADRIEFFNLAQQYPSNGFMLSDLPSTITYLKSGTQEHKITNNHNAPNELRHYERYFERLLEELDWKPVTQH